ncbi:MAG: NAD-binding protein, partial [Pseudomonadota bacterium]
KMVDIGIEDGGKMVPLAFAMVFATVLAHGFSIGPLAQRWGLAQKGRPGILIVGASPWSTALAEKLKELKIPVLITDASYRALRTARNRGLDTFYGEILSEVSEHHIEFVRYNTLLAVTGNESHNALVCTDLAHEMDRARTFQLSTRGQEEHRQNLSYAIQGRPLFAKPMGLEGLMKRHYGGWGFQLTRISDAYPREAFLEAIGEDSIIVAVERDEQLLFVSGEHSLNLKPNDRVLAYVPPTVLENRAKKDANKGSAGSGDTKETLPSEEASLDAAKEKAIDAAASASSSAILGLTND